jgi:copper chaperone CopZ
MMTRANAVLLFLLFGGGLGACSVDTAAVRENRTAEVAPGESQATPAQFVRADFHVEGMTCGGCAVGTRAALRKLDGVTDAGASYEDSRAWATYDPSRIRPERMMAAIWELGYTPTLVPHQP